MYKFFEKHSVLKLILFLISCVGVYGGAVNYGGFDFLPAIPFLAFVVFVSVKWKKLYRTATLALIFICASLYLLKLQHGSLFHPALEKEFMFKYDVCLAFYEKTAFVRKLDDKNPCVSDLLVKAKTPLKISRISVSNADMGEVYVIHSKTPHGELYYSFNYDRGPVFDNLAIWPNGEPIQQEDLRRDIFYVPSLMMYWPVFPILLLSR